jgi:ankyrin repeat protein
MTGNRAMTGTMFYRAITFFVVLSSSCLCGLTAASSQENAAAATPDSYAFTAAYDAKDFSGIDSLVNAGLDVAMRTHGGKTLLAYAASNAEDEAFAVSVARLLLSKGAGVNGEDSFGRVPLVYAIEEDRKAMAELLLDTGADVTLRSSAYAMPLVFVPFMRQNAALAHMMVSRCPDVNIRDSLANTPLSWASRFGYLDTASLLLDKGALVDALSVHNKTPLMETAEKGRCDIAELLVRKGADVNIQTRKGWSALMWAAEKGYDDIVSLLIGAGADLFAKNNRGERALIIARKNNHPATAKIIEKAEFRYWLRKIAIYGILASLFVILTVFAVRYVRRKRGRVVPE